MRIMESFMVSQYLQLLGCENASAVSEKNLFLLHEKHLEYIPYTNYRIFFNAAEKDFSPILLTHFHSREAANTGKP